jgi:hypothetical protein
VLYLQVRSHEIGDASPTLLCCEECSSSASDGARSMQPRDSQGSMVQMQGGRQGKE